MASTKNWPPSTGLNTPHVPAANSNLTLHASTQVSAPASAVWETLNDTPSWSNWNTWIPICNITSQPPSSTAQSAFETGTEFTMLVRMNPSKPDAHTTTSLRISSITTPDSKSKYVAQGTLDEDPSYEASATYRISWRDPGTGLMARVLQAERFHEIIPTGEQSCEVRTWECQGGVLVHVVKAMYGKFLSERFEVWVNDLKGEAERRWGMGREG